MAQPMRVEAWPVSLESVKLWTQCEAAARVSVSGRGDESVYVYWGHALRADSLQRNRIAGVVHRSARRREVRPQIGVVHYHLAVRPGRHARRAQVPVGIVW